MEGIGREVRERGTWRLHPIATSQHSAVRACVPFASLFSLSLSLSSTHRYTIRMSACTTEFRLPSNVVYLNTAGCSLQPVSVSAIGTESLLAKETPWQGLRGGSSDTDVVRQLFAALIDDDPRNIAIAPSTAFAMTLAARNIQRQGLLGPGDSVVVLEKDMASVVYPWQTICAETGAELEVIPFGLSYESHDWTTSILRVLDDETKDIAVLALPNVHWCDGTFVDLKAIVERIDEYELSHIYHSEPRHRRPLLIVDGTQSIGALPFSLRSVRADFVACSVHKWLLAPYGMSLMYVAPHLQSIWQPLDLHERARIGSNTADWDEQIFFHDARGFPTEFFPDARKFDAGGRPNAIVIPMAIRSLDVVTKLTVSHIQEHARTLSQALTNAVSHLKAFLEVSPCERSGHILGIKATSQYAARGLSMSWLGEQLKKNNVFLSVRGERLRVSFHVVNSLKDVHVFAALLSQLIVEFRLSAESESALSLTARTVWITGAHGWLAQFVIQRLLAESAATEEPVRIVGTYSREDDPPQWLLENNRMFLDFTDSNHLQAAITQCRPDAVIHLAALTSPVKCHAMPSLAHAVNCPAALTNALKSLDPEPVLVFASTDMVFDGAHAPYAFDAERLPVNEYGKTKRDFEDLVLTELTQSVVLRLSNMIGKAFVYQPTGEKFLQFLLRCHSEHQVIGLKSDERRSFVAVADVVEVISRVLRRYLDSRRQETSLSLNREQRILNVGGPEGLSRLQLANLLASHLGTTLRVLESDEPMSECPNSTSDCWTVYSVKSADAPNDSQVTSPLDITMNVTSTELVLGMQFSTLDAALHQCL